jgi:Fe-S-cluster-containing dehydrogenase component
MRKGFIFDLNKCVGCYACVVACQIENGNEQTHPWREISTFNSFQHPNIPVFHFSMACNHCKDAPCMDSCPALAYSKGDILNSINLVAQNCIGCKYCTWACPYDAPKYINAKGIIEKCTLCTSRLEQELKPACANLCPTGALDFDEINPEARQHILGFTDKEISPGIKFVPIRSKKSPIEKKYLKSDEAELYKRLQLKPINKISIKSEWVLIVFTLLAAILTAIISDSVILQEPINKWIFLLAGIVGMGLSALHLGKKRRAWRAILNVNSSWLSREILSYILFIAISFIFLITLDQKIGYLAAIMGFILCYCIDRLYKVTNTVTPIRTHSSNVLLSAVLFTLVIGGGDLLFYLILYLKFFLYLYRKYYFKIHHLSTRPIFSTIRISFGFIIPVLMLLYDSNLFYYAVPFSIIIGEITDRIEFYLELDISTPKNQINKDLSSMLGSMPF